MKIKGNRWFGWRLVVGMLLFSSLSGCASFVRMELPDELKTKKLKEDPPISMNRPAIYPRQTREA
jgi:hypothetical protein